MIALYPDFSPLAMEQRPLLHPLFQALPDGVSEFSFANVYLFRQAHAYRVARLPEAPPGYVFAGRDGSARDFFMLPFGLPGEALLADLFARFGCLKNATASQAAALAARGHRVEPDRDNFDYLYSRSELAQLPGPRFHKKKNLVSKFARTTAAEGWPLFDELLPDALRVLEAWRGERLARDGQRPAEGTSAAPDPTGLLAAPGDYAAAREALERACELQLCGNIYYVDLEPVAYTLGEETALGRSFVVHFEKAAGAERYPGIYQYINQSFAANLPEAYETINREQDLGDPGLRQAKESYQPVGFVEKYRVYAA